MQLTATKFKQYIMLARWLYFYYRVFKVLAHKGKKPTVGSEFFPDPTDTPLNLGDQNLPSTSLWCLEFKCLQLSLVLQQSQRQIYANGTQMTKVTGNKAYIRKSSCTIVHAYSCGVPGRYFHRQTCLTEWKSRGSRTLYCRNMIKT